MAGPRSLLISVMAVLLLLAAFEVSDAEFRSPKAVTENPTITSPPGVNGTQAATNHLRFKRRGGGGGGKSSGIGSGIASGAASAAAGGILGNLLNGGR